MTPYHPKTMGGDVGGNQAYNPEQKIKISSFCLTNIKPLDFDHRILRVIKMLYKKTKKLLNILIIYLYKML